MGLEPPAGSRSVISLFYLSAQQYLYGTQARHLSYNDFINKELILFSNSDNERSIPSLVDGSFPTTLPGLFSFEVH